MRRLTLSPILLCLTPQNCLVDLVTSPARPLTVPAVMVLIALTATHATKQHIFLTPLLWEGQLRDEVRDGVP